MRDVFFVQRAAIDVLLLNKATAIEICVYLVICKYTDRNGYLSGVGYKTIKDRVGIGQRKASDAIKRLLSMEYDGQKLLYTFDSWVFNETGALPKSDNNCWVIGWFESSYKHHVWLSNDLVGCNGDTINRPLSYFTFRPKQDDHARMLLLLFKYYNRHYAGVNYRLASIKTSIESSHTIAEYKFHKSTLENYHISSKTLKIHEIKITHKKACKILDDLRDNKFLNISITVLGNHNDPEIPAGKIKKNNQENPTRKRGTIVESEKQIAARQKWLDAIAAYEKEKKALENGRDSFKLALRTKNRNLSIKLVKTPTNRKLKDVADLVMSKLEDPVANAIPVSKFVYHLDYKSTDKRKLDLNNCLAATIEKIAKQRELEAASRNGKFYKSYWWFNPGLVDVSLNGIITPTYSPPAKLSAYSELSPILNSFIEGQ